MISNIGRLESSIDELGLAPSVELVDEWFTKIALYTRYKIGSSLQDRDLYIYSSKPLENHDEERMPIVLFLSLVHGN
jgi:hypothetical protein